MENIQFENFTIKIKDLVTDKENDKVILYVTDSEINANEFDAFMLFFKEHRRGGNYFTTTINGDDFYGRFGQMIYSKQDDFYNLRLVFVVAEADQEQEEAPPNPFVIHGPDHENLIEKVLTQEIIIHRLLRTLKNNGILTANQASDIVSINDDDTWMNRSELYYKVDNLDAYLEEKRDTLIHIKKQEEEN